MFAKLRSIISSHPFFPLIVVGIFLIIGIFFQNIRSIITSQAQHVQESLSALTGNQHPESPPAGGSVYFYDKPLSFLKLFGQKRLGDTSYDAVVNSKIHHSAGILVDQSVRPNRIYAVDTGNNRILGYKSLGTCTITNQQCTNDTDCNGNTCNLNTSKPADIVIGQPQADPTESTCNRDNNFGALQTIPNNLKDYRHITDRTLCLTPYPYATNIGEFWMRINFDVDKEGNLYVPDVFNNRILRYNQPLSGDTSNGKGDTVADYVWGQTSGGSENIQPDFTIGLINNGKGIQEINDHSLNLSRGEYYHVASRGVSIDPHGNLWVADSFNYRVLRFPKKTDGTIALKADIVIGQRNFDERSSICQNTLGNKSTDMSKLCIPTLARINPETNDLYVLDEYPDGFRVRILVYTADAQGNFQKQSDGLIHASRIIIPKQNTISTLKPSQISSKKNRKTEKDNFTLSMDDIVFPDQEKPSDSSEEPYTFRSTGFVFNTFKTNDCTDPPTCTHHYNEGVLWVNEHNTFRTLLLDTDGNILKVIGSLNAQTIGCKPYNYGSSENTKYQDFNLCWPGGSIGIDNANNLYFADELYNRMTRFSLPYNTTNSYLPNPNGGLFKGTQPNTPGPAKWGGSVGALVYQGKDSTGKQYNQLIVKDTSRYLVWNNYLTRPNGDTADLFIGQTNNNGDTKTPNFLGTRSFHAVDDKNHLWTVNGQGRILVYQLPFKIESQPIANDINLYWSDDINGRPIDFNSYELGFAFFNSPDLQKQLWLVDGKNSRLLRIKNYDDVGNANSKLIVDAVIGQKSKSGTGCNQGRDFIPPGARFDTMHPTDDSMCRVSQIKFDQAGNLYVVDNTYECINTNDRILMFEGNDIQAIHTNPNEVVFPDIHAKKVFIQNAFTTDMHGSCDSKLDEPHSPVSLAFNSCNEMIVGNDGYYKNIETRQTHQIWYYHDPLAKYPDGSYVQGQKPDGYIDLPMGSLGEMQFDKDDNLMVQDHTWNKLWMININNTPDRDSWLRWTIPNKPAPPACTKNAPTPLPSQSYSIPIKLWLSNLDANYNSTHIVDVEDNENNCFSVEGSQVSAQGECSNVNFSNGVSHKINVSVRAKNGSTGPHQKGSFTLTQPILGNLVFRHVNINSTVGPGSSKYDIFPRINVSITNPDATHRIEISAQPKDVTKKDSFCFDIHPQDSDTHGFSGYSDICSESVEYGQQYQILARIFELTADGSPGKQVGSTRTPFFTVSNLDNDIDMTVTIPSAPTPLPTSTPTPTPSSTPTPTPGRVSISGTARYVSDHFLYNDFIVRVRQWDPSYQNPFQPGPWKDVSYNTFHLNNTPGVIQSFPFEATNLDPNGIYRVQAKHYFNYYRPGVQIQYSTCTGKIVYDPENAIPLYSPICELTALTAPGVVDFTVTVPDPIIYRGSIRGIVRLWRKANQNPGRITVVLLEGNIRDGTAVIRGSQTIDITNNQDMYEYQINNLQLHHYYHLFSYATIQNGSATQIFKGLVTGCIDDETGYAGSKWVSNRTYQGQEYNMCQDMSYSGVAEFFIDLDH